MGPDSPSSLIWDRPAPFLSQGLYERAPLFGRSGSATAFCVEENYKTCFQSSFMKIRARIRREYRILVSDRFLLAFFRHWSYKWKILFKIRLSSTRHGAAPATPHTPLQILWAETWFSMVAFYSSVSFINHWTLTFVHPYGVLEGKTNFRI